MIILLVDDEFPARQELRFILEQLLPEATFYEASDGDEALAIVAKLNADVIFLDINMPGENGLSVATTIMDSPQPPLIVFATAYDQHALKAFELAALDYVVKPFSMRRLTKTVAQIRQRLGDKNRLVKQQALIQRSSRPSQPATGRQNYGRKRKMVAASSFPTPTYAISKREKSESTSTPMMATNGVFVTH